MKSALAALLLLFPAAAFGQNAKTPPEPASASTFYYLDFSAQLVPLESQVVQMKHNYRDLGFAGGSTIYQVKGDKSPMRLKANGKPEFVVRLEGGYDPLEAVWVRHFDAVRGSRVMPIADFNALGNVSKVTLEPAVIDFNAAKYGSSSIKIVPIEPLTPGEYCLIIRAPGQLPKRTNAFCFGVDVAVK
jgi:hypothetical protein